MINSRLFTTVRDSLGLTYDVSFELSLFDRMPSGWFHVNVTSTPQVRAAAAAASWLLDTPPRIWSHRKRSHAWLVERW